MKKKIVAAGLTAGLLAGAGVAFALESSGSAGASSPAAQVASSNIDANSLTGSAGSTAGVEDREAMIRQTLQPLVDDGTITQDQLDKVVAALVAAGPGDGDNDGGMGHGGVRGIGLQTVADTLGITVDEVRTAIQGGTTLADLATQHGKTAQDLIDALVAEVTTRLDAAVKAGTITQDQADTRLAAATTQITEFVNNTQAAGPMGGDRAHGPGGMGDHGGMGSMIGGMGGQIDGGPTDDTTTTNG